MKTQWFSFSQRPQCWTHILLLLANAELLHFPPPLLLLILVELEHGEPASSHDGHSLRQPQHSSATMPATPAAYLHSRALARNWLAARLNSVTEKTPPSLSSYNFLGMGHRERQWPKASRGQRSRLPWYWGGTIVSLEVTFQHNTTARMLEERVVTL